MKSNVSLITILLISVGISQNIALIHTLEGREDCNPIGDIDGDGIPELIVEVDQNDGSESFLEIYDGETLELKWTSPAGYSDGGIELGSLRYFLSPFLDFNGDGNLDLITEVENGDEKTGFVIYDIVNNAIIYEYDFLQTVAHRDGQVLLTDINGDDEVEIICNFEYSDDGGETQQNTIYIFSTGVLLDVEQNFSLPNSYKINQNFPNPFNPITTIEYEIPQSGNVNISIYNIKGELVERLINDYKQIGKYSIQWNPKNISSGQYFYQISVDGFVQTKKMVLLK